MDGRRETARDGADDLRRRLYRPGATEADVQRYLAGRGDGTALEPAPEGDVDRPPPRRRIRPIGIGLATLVLVAVLAIVVTRPGLIGDGRPGPTASAVTAGTPLLVDIGDGQVLAVDTAAVTGPARVATSLDGTAVAGQRFTGRGNGAVTVEPPPGAQRGGRAVVALTAAGTAPVRWRALLLVSRADWSTYPVVMARGSADRPSAPVPPTAFAYTASPPTRIAVAAPPGVRWRLVVGVAPGPAPDLR